MANAFGRDILIQAPDPRQTAQFYVKELGFAITGDEPHMVSLEGAMINLYIERGPKLGPVLEVTVEDVGEAKARLVKSGCTVIKDEPEFPRCYVQDPHGLTYNLLRAKAGS
jgi:predicted enzyme related to lactoylglutathione lyase